LSILIGYGVLAVANDSKSTELSPVPAIEKSEADKIVDGMDFGELCNEFECISSPLVESTARQLARDILQLREGNRALGTYAVSVRYRVSMTFLPFLLQYLACSSLVLPFSFP
jgi:hypothetical protein